MPDELQLWVLVFPVKRLNSTLLHTGVGLGKKPSRAGSELLQVVHAKDCDCLLGCICTFVFFSRKKEHLRTRAYGKLLFTFPVKVQFTLQVIHRVQPTLSHKIKKKVRLGSSENTNKLKH